jgi:hypothetical protein
LVKVKTLYAIQIVSLIEKGKEVSLSLYGEGVLKNRYKAIF